MSASDVTPRIRIAVLQESVATGDPAVNLEAIRRAAGAAADEGARLLLTPEMFVTGYNLGARVAEVVREPLLDQLVQIAREAKIAVVAGLPLTDGKGITNSAVLISAAGELVLRYDKTHLFGDLDRSMFVPGASSSPVVEWNGVRVGLLICYDVEFPENVRALAQAGADLVLVPTAQMEPFEFVADHVLRVRAWESQVYIAYADLVGSEGQLRYVGRSSVSAPDGRADFAGPTEPALLIADIDPALLARSRAENPYLADLRPELYATGHASLDPVTPRGA